MNWFLYDNSLCHERVKLQKNENTAECLSFQVKYRSKRPYEMVKIAVDVSLESVRDCIRVFKIV